MRIPEGDAVPEIGLLGVGIDAEPALVQRGEVARGERVTVLRRDFVPFDGAAVVAPDAVAQLIGRADETLGNREALRCRELEPFHRLLHVPVDLHEQHAQLQLGIGDALLGSLLRPFPGFRQILCYTVAFLISPGEIVGGGAMALLGGAAKPACRRRGIPRHPFAFGIEHAEPALAAGIACLRLGAAGAQDGSEVAAVIGVGSFARRRTCPPGAGAKRGNQQQETQGNAHGIDLRDNDAEVSAACERLPSRSIRDCSAYGMMSRRIWAARLSCGRLASSTNWARCSGERTARNWPSTAAMSFW